MSGGTRAQCVLACLVLGLGGSSSVAGRMVLDPGVTDSVMPAAVLTTDMLVEPGAWGRLDMALGEYRIEVMSGEVSVVFTADRRILSAGDSRVIPAGTAFGVLNAGSVPARLRVSVLALH